jgi:hypothetical protein
MGFALSVHDVRALRKGILAEADTIGDRVREVRASRVASADFGDAEREGTGAEYVRVVHDVLAKALGDLGDRSRALAARLDAMSRHYEDLEDDNRVRLVKLDGEWRS